MEFRAEVQSFISENCPESIRIGKLGQKSTSNVVGQRRHGRPNMAEQD
ncbi:MAG: hypothetical protein J4G19_08740 [Pseudomonadales bacterium]|nr:hypothetical protein [Pseudomonadales bacterium]